MTTVNRQSFLCPLSMATGYLSVLLQSLGRPLSISSPLGLVPPSRSGSGVVVGVGWGGVGDVLLLRCILFVPMSTIDGYWLSFGTTTAARGRCARFVVFLRPSGGALIGCARNRKPFRHMASGIKPSETSTNYL